MERREGLERYMDRITRMGRWWSGGIAVVVQWTTKFVDWQECRRTQKRYSQEASKGNETIRGTDITQKYQENMGFAVWGGNGGGWGSQH